MSDIEHETHDRLMNLQKQIENLSGEVVLIGDIMLDSCLLYTSDAADDC